MAATSLATLAGAHGELGGVLMMRAYHLARGDSGRTKMGIPDSAHGTNPASAAMAGFDVVTIPSDADGNTDLAALREIASNDLAGVMITLPSTLGLFDTNILEVCQIVHDCGGLVYGDGANMNALLGRAKLGELGFDVCHLNLHKTFSTPHGGGGPGAGPVCCGENLAPYLAAPVVTANGSGEYALSEPEQSIGKISGFHGNFGVLVRAYTYIRTLGAAGLLSISGNAVLNANYIMESLKNIYELPYHRTCMHEVVFFRRPAAGARRQRPGGGETAAGLWFPRSDNVLPAHCARSPDDRTHGVGNQGNAGRIHRRSARHRRGGHVRTRARSARPALDAGVASRRSDRRPASGPALGGGSRLTGRVSSVPS